MITPVNALKMSIWLAHAHPQAFRTILSRVRATTPVSARTVRRLGALGCGCSARPLGYTLGYFGQADSGLETVTVDASAGVDAPVDVGPIDTSVLDNPTLTDASLPDSVNIAGDLASAGDATSIDTSFFDTTAAPSSDASSGFWNSLGSAVSGGLSAVGSAVGTVAKAITSPQVLTAAGAIAGAGIAANAVATRQAQQAQLQQAVLNTQLGRVQAGRAPAPIVYAPTPQAVQQPLLYNPSTGQYQPVTASILGGLSTGSIPWTPILLIGGAVVLLGILSGPSYSR